MAQTRGQDNGEEIVAFISEGLSRISENLHFNIGGNHEFTFAVSGNTALFFLLPYVTANLPEPYRDKWSFFPCMQGTGGVNFTFVMYEKNVDIDRVMVAPVINEGGKTIDLRFYSEAWESMDEKDCYNAFFILLELSVGEALAHSCVNYVEKAEAFEDGMFSLTELEQRMLDTLCENGEPPNPADRYFSYGRADNSQNSLNGLDVFQNGLPLRQDIIVGTTNHPNALGDYADGRNDCWQSFADFGAKLIFLYYYYDSEADRNEILAERYALMDKLEEEVLGERGSGREIGLVLGGAIGESRAYIDLLLYDEQTFMKKARRLLEDVPFLIFGKEFYQDGEEFLLADPTAFGFNERLQQLHEVGAYKETIKIIEGLPAEKKDFEMISLYARALNNDNQEEKAIGVLESVRGQGENDALWNWRMGYALYFTDRKADSIPYLQKAIELGDDHAETAELLLEALMWAESKSEDSVTNSAPAKAKNEK
jgi:hypothetical protein